MNSNEIAVANSSSLDGLLSIEKVKYLEQELSNEIFGQNYAIKKVVDKLKIRVLGFDNKIEKPIASFLFTGPTGVGKTELAKQLAKSLNIDFLRYDMSEYNNEYSIQNFIGGQAGLVGYEDGGILTNDVMEKPKSVILFDEIEKAHKRVLNILLQILDYGKLTDTKGNKVNFRNTIIILTSNLSSKSIVKKTSCVGFVQEYTDEIIIEENVSEFLTPELRARLDDVVEFNPLNDEMIKSIIDKEISYLAKHFTDKNKHFKISKNSKRTIFDIAKDTELGSRFVQNLINKTIKQSIANALIANNATNDYLGVVVVYNSYKKTFVTKIIEQMIFNLHSKACEFAKKNVGTIITKNPNGAGWIAKNYFVAQK